MNLKLNLLLPVFCSMIHINAQDNFENSLVNLMESLVELPGENHDLSDAGFNPGTFRRININTSLSELNSLNIFSLSDIGAIRKHLEEYGPLKSIYELQTIVSLDSETMSNLKSFVMIKDEPLQKLKAIKAQQLIRIASGRSTENSVEKTYSGSPIKWSAIYESRRGEFLRYGFRCEKDAGEKGNYAFRSAFFQITPGKTVKSMIAGDQQIAFGQGLLLGSGLRLGKSSMVMQVLKFNKGARPNTSMNETGFIRGLSTVLQTGRYFSTTLFAGIRQLDANLYTDSTGETFYRSLISSGYYRNEREIESRHTVRQEIAGVHSVLKKNGVEIGSGIIFSRKEQKQINSIESFKNDSKGKINFKGGLDWKWQIDNLLTFGELIVSENGRPSFLSGLLMAAGKSCDLSILYRNYNSENEAEFSNAFGEAGQNRNEKGIYSGLSIQLPKRLNLSLYNDLSWFSMPKYRTSHSSFNNEQFAELRYADKNKNLFYIRVKFNEKQMYNSENANLKSLVTHSRNRIRLHFEYELKGIKLRNRFEQTFSKIENIRSGYGMLLYQDIRFGVNSKLKISARYTVFDSDDYESRSFAFENDLPGSFSIPSYNGKGSSYYIMAEYPFKKDLKIWLRFARSSQQTPVSGKTAYSQLQTRSELQIQCQLKF